MRPVGFGVTTDFRVATEYVTKHARSAAQVVERAGSGLWETVMATTRRQRILVETISDLGLLASIAALCYGSHQVFPPSAWIVGGALGLVYFFLLGRADGDR